jgi:hypothetical protein
MTSRACAPGRSRHRPEASSRWYFFSAVMRGVCPCFAVLAG